ncbi:uncharacterized protein C8Q71DRAFT_792895 [Rhodofomes roseus]|uniref:Uncharacterized protein n=1 Tax=Rhodofomes roseus TaxID=34475 RepID=A0ABQ8JYK3_9APHY|nr:uncharacterized protein C8Q71DRAFT_792895 [Rhodofomes roseus]KAH9828671.1 hypothetical protein C8Q71DRAFT_792895 [Rhodofomes roseus]
MKWEHTEDVDALHEQGLLSSPRARAGVVSTAVNRLQLAQVEDLSDAAEDLSYVDDLSDVDSPSEHSDSGYGDPSSDYVQSAESSSEGFDVEHSVGNDGKRTSARLRHEAAPYVRTSLSPDAVLRARRNAANQHEGPQVAKRSSGAASGAGETRKNDGVHAAKSVQDVNNKHNLKPRTMAPKPLLPLPQTSKGAKLRTQPSPEDPFRYHRITLYAQL